MHLRSSSLACVLLGQFGLGWSYSLSSRATSLQDNDGDSALERLGSTLMEKCGTACVEIWDAAIANLPTDNNTGDPEWSGALIALAEAAQEQLRHADAVNQ